MKICCPKCGQDFNVEAHIAGKSVQCSQCNEVFIARAQRKCPMCGEPLAEESVVCIACGTHLLTGRQISTRHEADLPEPAEEEEEAEPSAADRIVMGIGMFAPGLFRPKVLIVSALVIMVGFAILGLAMVIVKLAAFSGLLIAASGLIVYAQGIAMILSGEITMLPDAMLEFDTGRWCLFIVLIPIPFVIMFALMKHYSAM